MARYKISVLSQTQRDALLRGATIFIDELFDDYAHIQEGGAIKECTALTDCLPRQFRHRYCDELFVKSFIVYVVRVADRLAAWQNGVIPASTAESLALRAIIERAKVWLETEGGAEGKDYVLNFDRFVEAAFPDLDIEFLFDPAWDGIENADVAAEMGMFLKPTQWFDEAYGPVHPYIYL